MSYDSTDKLLRGVYKIELKWDLIWLYNIETKAEETIKRDSLATLMLQSFSYDVIDNFFEKLYDGEKFIVDFDKEKIKLIRQKESSFESAMGQYFTAENIQQEIDNGYEPFDIYKKEGIEWLE